jgi:signal transduction histidine kinase
LSAFSVLLPRRLAGRVLLILFGGLVLALTASFALFAVERARALDRFVAWEVAARIAERLRSPGGPESAAHEGGPRGRLAWREVDATGSPPEAGGSVSDTFQRELRRRLIESVGSDPVAWIVTLPAERPAFEPSKGRPIMTPPPAGMRMDRGAAAMISVALALPDGRKAVADAFVFRPALQIPTEGWVSLGVLFAVTAVFSIVAVRLALQPLRTLANAAERLSQNIDAPPLEERGGTEMRAAARAFNRMQDRLRRHVNTRALAFASMSHDIRTPLTRMRLRLESLGPEARAKLTGDLADIESITTSALAMARELSPDETMSRVDLQNLVERVVATHAPPTGATIKLTGSCAPLSGRPIALRRALANLIDNGLKHGGTALDIEIRDSRDHVDIDVRDRGPGIPEEHLEKVVYPFYRVESSRNRDTGGSGLGLAIVKDVVEAHGGELLLENRAPSGFCASIRLPR